MADKGAEEEEEEGGPWGEKEVRVRERERSEEPGEGGPVTRMSQRV